MNLVEVGIGLGNLHNTGQAHGHPRFQSLEEFHDALKKLCDGLPNVVSILSFTNSQQNVERGYLKELGFSSQKYKYVQMHYIDVKNIGGMTEAEKAERAKVEEERKKAAEEALAAKRANYKYNAEGRRLNADGTIFRRPGELLIGDTIWVGYGSKIVVKSIEKASCDCCIKINGKRDLIPKGSWTLVERAK